MSKNIKVNINAEPGKKQEFVIISEFDAPREIVFRAYTDPKLYAQWLGPRSLKMRIEKFQPKNGGSYRYISIDEKGKEFASHGVFHEVRFPDRIINTFEFEGLPESGHVLLETSIFENLPGGRTRVTIQDVFQSAADRDGMLSSGMEEGINESFERLTELLAGMQKLRKAA